MYWSNKRDTAIEESGATTFDSSPHRGGEMLGSYQTTQALGRWLSFPPKLAQEIGIEETIFLLNLVFHASEGAEWVVRSPEQLEQDTSLTYKQQLRVREHLEARGLIEQETRRRIHETKYRVVEEAFDALILSLKTKKEFEQLPKGNLSNFPKGDSSSSQREVDSLRKEEVQKEEQELESLPLRQEERRAIPKPVREPKVRRFQKTLPPKREYVPAPKQPDSWVWFATVFKRLSDVNAVTMPELWPMVDDMLSELSRDEAEERLGIYIDGAAKVSGWLARDFLGGGWKSIDPEDEHLPRIVNDK